MWPSMQVRYLFGWEESERSAEESLCHPLCQCDKCARLRKVRVQNRTAHFDIFIP